MRITLIYPNIGNIPSYNFGLGVIAAYLKQNGHEVQGIYIDSKTESEIDLERIEKDLKKFSPELIGFSCVSNQYKFVKHIIRHLKKKKIKSKIIIGGIHATLDSENILKEDVADVVCLGEGENAILELANKLEKKADVSRLNNLWSKKKGCIIKNGIGPLIEDLGSLPFADRSLFEFDQVLEKKRGWAEMMTGRGCPFGCSYCVNNFLKKMNKGVCKVRLRPVEYVLAEIAEIEKYHKIKMINFHDDTFTLDKKWVLKFCEEYQKKFKYPFACNVRSTNFDEEIATTLKKAGCAEVKIGLESGSRRVREEVLNRFMTNDQIETAFTIAKKLGIRAWSFNMIGMPTETKEELLETIKLNAKIRPYILRCSILFPYKGTDIYERCVKEGRINKEKEFEYASYFDGTILKLEHLTEADVLRYKTLFRWYVDAHSDIEMAGFYKQLTNLFEELSEDMWKTGEAQKLFKQIDEQLDNLFKLMKKEHYSSRSHLDLNFSAETGWELP